MRHLGLLTLVVPDYDEAIAYYTGVLGFALRCDTPLAEEGKPGKRWVVVAPDPDAETGLLLARAAGQEQRARVGDQTGGRVGFFLYTDDFAADHARLSAAGVTFTRAPREEPYGRVAVFADRYGNLWDLIQPASGPSA
ncbi:VOC family protein [Streptomyces hoynatensis]|uniref:VOC family protein n=1 Tax=Streptomyces hoynatensis TaxID=1141874 RepID=A0A3A9Z7K2_9ACTN|nr:VOC family protein [Streptomyces hoynatensis]RKN43196.1 VOC family protein [Streptomyces hoynatensis]